MGPIILSSGGYPVITSTAYERREGTLFAEGVSTVAIADAVGTPAYVYSAGTVRTRYRRLAKAFHGVPHRIHFAMKANANLSILRLLRGLGAGVDIVSGGELFRAREAGFQGSDVVFSGVGKTRREIEDALDAEVALINVESEAELRCIDEVAAQRGAVAPVAFRLNPEVTVSTPHAYIRTGEKGNKFGLSREEIGRLLRVLTYLPNVSLRGIGMHLGSQIQDAEALRTALPVLVDAITAARAAGQPIDHMDVGGGLAVPYESGEPEADVEGYAQLVKEAALALGVQVLLEPGRFLVAEAGVLLTRVVYRKESAGTAFVITDAGMSDLIRPSLYDAHHEIEAVQAVERQVVADVVGPICESGDFFAKRREVADVAQGELLAIRTTGAYGYTMASNYNARPRPVEVLVDGDQFAVIAEREQYEDLVRLERTALTWRSA